jgi:hypothetical protein
MELCAGVPANWMVFVVVDWAFAEKVANAIKTARQNKTAAEFPRKPDLLCANVTVVMDCLTLAFPSRKPWLPRSLSDVQEGIIQLLGTVISGSAVKLYLANQGIGLFYSLQAANPDFQKGALVFLPQCRNFNAAFILQSREE